MRAPDLGDIIILAEDFGCRLLDSKLTPNRLGHPDHLLRRHAGIELIRAVSW